MELGDIPESQDNNFPQGVSEYSFKTEPEMDAFVSGIGVADALDVVTGPVFVRDAAYVIRVRVGNWE